jgi:hypothetical protein
MSSLISKALHEINGPELHVSTSVCEMGLTTVSVSFDASKFPFQVKRGIPDKVVSLSGAKFLSAEEAELDALKRFAYYISCKFGVLFADCSYEKLCLAGKKILELETIIEHIVSNIKSMLCNRKATIGILIALQRNFAFQPTPLHLVVCGELLNLKSEVQACLHHISIIINNTYVDYANCCNTINNASQTV